MSCPIRYWRFRLCAIFSTLLLAAILVTILPVARYEVEYGWQGWLHYLPRSSYLLTFLPSHRYLPSRIYLISNLFLLSHNFSMFLKTTPYICSTYLILWRSDALPFLLLYPWFDVLLSLLLYPCSDVFQGARCLVILVVGCYSYPGHVYGNDEYFYGYFSGSNWSDPIWPSDSGRWAHSYSTVRRVSISTSPDYNCN